MYKLSLHIICTRSVIKFSVLGGKYRTDFRYFRYLIVDTLNKQSTIFKLYITSMYKLSLHMYTFCKVLSPRRQIPNRLSVFSFWARCFLTYLMLTTVR